MYNRRILSKISSRFQTILPIRYVLKRLLPFTIKSNLTWFASIHAIANINECGHYSTILVTSKVLIIALWFLSNDKTYCGIFFLSRRTRLTILLAVMNVIPKLKFLVYVFVLPSFKVVISIFIYRYDSIVLP